VPAAPRRPALAALAVALIATAAIIEYARTASTLDTLRTVPAAALAVAVAGLAVSLPGLGRRGLLLGGLFVAAGLFTWTFTSRPLVIWGVLAAQGAVAAVWAWPWLPGLRALPRLGTAWLGLAYWLAGALGALLVVHVGVAAQRVAYGGVFGLCAIAVLTTARRRGPGAEDPSVGIAAAVLLGLAALLFAGAGTLFAAVHAVPGTGASEFMRSRFWGGPGLYFHPNSMAGLAVLAAARIGPDRAFAAWQRLAVTVVTGCLLFLTNSRVGFVFAAAAAAVHAVLVLRRRHHADLPAYRRPLLAALLPFVVLGLVMAASGGQKFLTQSRFEATSGNDVTSGRLDTWGQVGRDWLRDGVVEKLLGNADTSRAVVIRDSDPPLPDGTHPKLNTDNAAVGAFRRGGVAGALAFAFGVLLLAYHLVLRRWWARRRKVPVPDAAPAWLLVAALGALPTIATEDWLLGGTNGAIWILLLAGEAYLLRAVPSGPTPAPPVESVGVAVSAEPAGVTAGTER
jgi:hypothetical protein